MNLEVRLKCPMCKNEFTTNRRDKIWCSRKCSNEFREVKKQIEANYRKQDNMNNNGLRYDIRKDSFTLLAFKTKER